MTSISAILFLLPFPTIDVSCVSKFSCEFVLCVVLLAVVAVASGYARPAKRKRVWGVGLVKIILE